MGALSFELTHRAVLGSRQAAAPPQPRQWQRRLLQLLRARLHNPDLHCRDVLLHAGPGAGKTLGALLSFQTLQQEGHLQSLVVFCHRTSIARQWSTAARRLGVELQPWEPLQSHAAAGGAGLLLSYQSAARHREALRDLLTQRFAASRWLAVADEVHHLGVDPEEPEAGAWGRAFSELAQSAALRLGLTGTPFRADALAFCAARRLRVEEQGRISERIVPDLCVESRQLIQAGDVRPLEFRFQDGWVDHGRDPAAAPTEASDLAQESRESWRARNLRRAIQPAHGGGIAQRLLIQARLRLERVREQHPGAAGLVIARDIDHARSISALLQEEGEDPRLVHSQDPEAAARLAAFRGGEGRWLVSVDMCTEGFDAPRLRVVVYLSTVVTRSRFVQAITRAVRIDGERSVLEGIPRDASFIYAPADPLLMGHARAWSLSEPYLLRTLEKTPEADVGLGSGRASPLPLKALADGAGQVIRLQGPELPGFLRQHKADAG
ncbi:MAG: DEAD/DEAH box helicase [Cyanobium sp.]